METQSIASNLIYNDGGEDIYVGFDGRCSIQNIVYNANKQGRWCSQKANSCYQYLNKAFKGQASDFPCNESRVFHQWTWNAGNDFKTGSPFYIRKSAVGKYCILTTQYSNTPENERRIVGFFRISKIENDTFLYADSVVRLRLTVEQSKALYFWAYYLNAKKPNHIKWSSKRYRYLTDMQVCAILHDIMDLSDEKNTREMIENAIAKDFPQFKGMRPNVIGAISLPAIKEFYLRRKYGKGGESEAHIKLKEYIAKNPQCLGLPRDAKATKEHLFLSGDLVDILFEYNQVNAVVEIELDLVIPGVHQAIKYRALRCSQMGIPIGDSSVKAYVVAWSFSNDAESLCRKYDISMYRKKL
jgi:hypothetical protein